MGNRKSKIEAKPVNPKLFQRLSTRNLLFDNPAEEEKYSDYDFPFENLVFEGGGTRGLAYVGAVRVLEEAGVMRKVKRFAGASAGAMMAAMLALGFNSQEIEDFLQVDLSKEMLDHSCGYCSLLPNILKGYGWNPGRGLMAWFGNMLQEHTGNPDLTFLDMYKMFGVELCIVVTNVNQMAEEYCHAKTTPDMPIRLAIRMSMSLPGIFQAVEHRHKDSGYQDYYIDGGLLVNYPIHCFDGWWLSMENKDAFINRLFPLDRLAKLFEKTERFGTHNPKSLGMVLFSTFDVEFMHTELSKRLGDKKPVRPKTKLSKQRTKKQHDMNEAAKNHDTVHRAVNNFLTVLAENNTNKDDKIEMRELELVFKKMGQPGARFTDDDAALLFGDNVDPIEVFAGLDKDNSGFITHQELVAFLEERGFNFFTQFLGYKRRPIESLGGFLETIIEAVMIYIKRVYIGEKDVHRTIGIDTDYLPGTDWKMEADDKKFLISQGERAAKAYLREWLKVHKLNKTTEPELKYISEEAETQSSTESTRAQRHRRSAASSQSRSTSFISVASSD